MLSVTSGEWAGAHRHTSHNNINNIHLNNININNINNINKNSNTTKMLDSLPEVLTRPPIPGYELSHMMGKFWGLLSPPGSEGSGSQEAEEQKIPTHSGR